MYEFISSVTRLSPFIQTFLVHLYDISLGKELSVEDDEEDDDEYILSAFEQCVFCLYNHPNKRRRAR